MEQSSGYSLINPALRAPYTIRALRPMPTFKHIVHLCELNEMFTPLPVYSQAWDSAPQIPSCEWCAIIEELPSTPGISQLVSALRAHLA